MEVILENSYSGQTLMKRFEVKPCIDVVEKEKIEPPSRLDEKSDHQSQDFISIYSSNDIAKELFDLMKPIKSGEEPVNSKLKETKKKKRGISR